MTTPVLPGKVPRDLACRGREEASTLRLPPAGGHSFAHRVLVPWHLWAGRGGEPGGPRRVPGIRGEGQGRGAWGGPGAGDRPVVCRDAGRGVRPAASEDVRKGVRQTAPDAHTPQLTFSRCPVCKTTRARAEAEMPPSRPATPTLRGRAPREGPRPNVAKSVLAPQRARRGAWTELLGGPRPRRPAIRRAPCCPSS